MVNSRGDHCWSQRVTPCNITDWISKSGRDWCANVSMVSCGRFCLPNHFNLSSGRPTISHRSKKSHLCLMSRTNCLDYDPLSISSMAKAREQDVDVMTVRWWMRQLIDLRSPHFKPSRSQATVSQAADSSRHSLFIHSFRNLTRILHYSLEMEMKLAFAVMFGHWPELAKMGSHSVFSLRDDNWTKNSMKTFLIH